MNVCVNYEFNPLRHYGEVLAKTNDDRDDNTPLDPIGRGVKTRKPQISDNFSPRYGTVYGKKAWTILISVYLAYPKLCS